MAYAPHNRIIASGTFDALGGVSAEIWSFSLCDDSGKTPQEVVTAAAPVFVDFIRGIAPQDSNVNTATHLTLVRCEEVDSAGKIVSSYGQDTAATGAAATTSLPFICCGAITLETAGVEPKGRKIRGRFYPPNNGLIASGNGFGTNFGLNLAQSGALLVTALNAAGLVICVASAVAGVNAAVISCSADNVVDTQRRRKNHAVGVRQAQTLPYSG